MLPFLSYISWDLLGECELLAKWMIGSLLYFVPKLFKKIKDLVTFGKSASVVKVIVLHVGI